MPEPSPDLIPDAIPVNVKAVPFSREWWLLQLTLILPTNWRQIVQWLILFGTISLVNWLTGKDIPIPDPPLPEFDLVIPDSATLSPEVIKELERRRVRVRCTGWKRPTGADRAATLRLLKEPRWEMTEAAGGGAGPDDDAPLWRFYQKTSGQPIPPHDQGPIGSCVSFGASLASEISLAAKIHGKRGPPQRFETNVREAVYGGSRINVDPRNPINGGDGSTGERAARWLSKGIGGLLPTDKHGSYSVQRCRERGNRGVPADLVESCRTNPCQATLVTSADQARQALQQGYAIFVCSDQGFSQEKDQDGFLRPYGQWMHCMCIAGYQGGQRKGFLIINSWGSSWVRGPPGKFNDIPPGSFWADYNVVDRMLRQGDSYAVADVDGFKKRTIAPEDWVP